MPDTFRQEYHPPSIEVAERVRIIKGCASELEGALNGMDPSRERALALTKLEECVMWAVKGATAPH